MNAARRVAFGGLFTAAALLCGYIEMLIPLQFGVPGVKLGLSNLVTVLLLYTVGAPMAFAVLLCRILLSALLFSNGMALMYSIAGGVLSFLVMVFLKQKCRLPLFAVSACGGLFHNAGQLAVAALVLQSGAIAFYIPVLCAAGILTGLLIGLLVSILLPRFRKLLEKENS